jgi:hypothetical protein
VNKKTRKPKQPQPEVQKCIIDPFSVSRASSEYDRFQTTLKKLLAVPKSEIDVTLKQEKRNRRTR